MPDNITTKFEDFVNNSPKKPRIKKAQIKQEISEFLTNSPVKMSVFEISKATGHKTDHVYTSLVSIKEIKSKTINGIAHWYINENQQDPEKKIIQKEEPKKLNESFMKSYEDDKKNSPNSRRIFLTSEEHMEYIRKKKR